MTLNDQRAAAWKASDGAHELLRTAGKRDKEQRRREYAEARANAMRLESLWLGTPTGWGKPIEKRRTRLCDCGRCTVYRSHC